MASAPSPTIADPSRDPGEEPKPGADRAIFTLSEPIRCHLGGVEIDLHGIEMRALRAGDLPLLDQYRGQPIALARGVVATLCDLTAGQVEQLCLEDFTMLASDALWQVEQVGIGMGLPSLFFVQSQDPVPAA